MPSASRFDFHPLVHALFLEADAPDGRVRGMALGVGRHPGRDGVHYLISDLSRPAPVWVADADVTQQRWADESRSEPPVPPALLSLRAVD